MKKFKREELRIRDPFIYTDAENGCYYMYGTTSLEDGSCGAKNTFSVYRSYDLENFEGPKVIFDGSQIDFWADRNFWAAELHKYKGRFYLFGTCHAEGKCKGTQIFVCDTPDGIFTPLADKPVTPSDWQSLDGTLWVENGIPYMVFCHEWSQVKDGEICAIQLSEDLAQPIGEPFLLFKASECPLISEYSKGTGKYVTDGPFLYNDDGRLNMLWSSFYQGKYQVILSQSDCIRGKWEHKKRLFDFIGGHAMLFNRLDGVRMIALHSPNGRGTERAFFSEY